MTDKSMQLQLRQDVLLAFQVALLGMVAPSLRGVTVAWGDHKVRGRCMFHGELGSDEHATASDIEAEVAASFPAQDIEVTAERCDFPEPLNDRGLMAWVYRRRE